LRYLSVWSASSDAEAQEFTRARLAAWEAKRHAAAALANANTNGQHADAPVTLPH
jgi:hypothetical protein